MKKTWEVAKVLWAADRAGMHTTLWAKIKFLASIHRKERKGEYNAVRKNF